MGISISGKILSTSEGSVLSFGIALRFRRWPGRSLITEAVTISNAQRIVDSAPKQRAAWPNAHAHTLITAA